MKVFFDVILWLVSCFLFIIFFAMFSDSNARPISPFFFILALSFVPILRNKINLKLRDFYIVNLKIEKEEYKEFVVHFIIGITKFVAFIFLFILFAIFIPTDTNVQTSKVTYDEVKIEKSKFRNNKNTKLIRKVTGLDKDRAGKIYETLVSCGVTNLSNIIYEKSVDAYSIEMEGVPYQLIICINKDGTIKDALFNYHQIIVNGKRVAKITDCYLTTREWISLQLKAEKIIKLYLKAPSTAKFKDMDYTINSEKIIRVYGNVEAQNLFGVPLITPYQVDFKKSDISEFIFIKGYIDGQPMK